MDDIRHLKHHGSRPAFASRAENRWAAGHCGAARTRSCRPVSARARLGVIETFNYDRHDYLCYEGWLVSTSTSIFAVLLFYTVSQWMVRHRWRATLVSGPWKGFKMAPSVQEYMLMPPQNEVRSGSAWSDVLVDVS